MPCIATLAAARIAERVELQACLREADASAPAQQAVAIDRHEMGESPTEPEVAMQPEAAVHGVDHAVTTAGELLPLQQERGRVARWRDRREGGRVARAAHWQATTPSSVAGAGGAIVPLNIAQVSGYDIGCVVIADQPPEVAPMMVSCVPLLVWKLSAMVSVL